MSEQPLDIRAQLGLSADATDEQISQVLADLRKRALGNLAGPEGWTGVAEGNGLVVFEKQIDYLNDVSFLDDFEGEQVEYFQVTRQDDTYRASVRIRRG